MSQVFTCFRCGITSNRTRIVADFRFNDRHTCIPCEDKAISNTSTLAEHNRMADLARAKGNHNK